MKQSTANVIGICKEISCKYCSASIRRNVAGLMANEAVLWGANKVTADHYTDEEIDTYIKNAFLDFVKTADSHSMIVNATFFNSINNRSSEIDKIIWAFKNVQVKNENGEYINGFTKEIVDQLEIDIEPDTSIR